MTLENINGTLLAYKELEQGTFLHVDQLTTERRTNHELRDQWFYTADGELYTVQKNKSLWVITREPQNLVLQNIDEAYRQLTRQGNYFPDADAAQASLDHGNSVVVNLKGLKLVRDNDQYGHFVVNPQKVGSLNAEQRKAALRIYGPDEENFGLNMEMFAEAGKKPFVFVLMPDHVQDTLRTNDKQFLGWASWLYYFDNYSYFSASVRNVDNHLRLRGVRCEIAEASREGSHERSDLSDALKKEVPRAPPETERIRSPTMEEILAVSRSHVPKFGWEQFQAEIEKLYK